MSILPHHMAESDEEKRTTPRTKRIKGKKRLGDVIIGEIQKSPDSSAQTKQIFEKVRLQYPKIHKRTIQRRIRELVNDGTLQEKDNHVYHVPYEIRLLASLFGGQAFLNMWSFQQKQLKGKLDERHIVEIFGVYMYYCFLKAAEATKNIKSFEDRMKLLRSMIPVMIDLKYGMYHKFVELLRYEGKPFPATSGFENRDKDTLGLDKDITTKRSERLKKRYRRLYNSLESSAKASGLGLEFSKIV